MKSGRREFITKLAAAGAAIPLGINAWSNGIFSGKTEKFPITLFTKPLDGFELDFMAETMAMAGLDGFDLAVRRGGRVIPERVADDLPKVVETGKKYSLSTPMMVTSIMEDQNHSGTRVGAPVWDVWELIHDFPVESVSSQFDIRHAVTEGAASWELALRLMSKNIGSIAVKDFTWELSKGKARVVSVPLGQGIIDFKRFFSILSELKIAAPISLHVEYPLLEGNEDNLPLLQKQKIIVTKLKTDVDFIRQHLNAV